MFKGGSVLGQDGYELSFAHFFIIAQGHFICKRPNLLGLAE